jgi:radical SAM superfamily enzyme YgiQ (UPF0313 family)
MDFFSYTPQKVYNFWKVENNGKGLINNFKDSYIIDGIGIDVWKLVNGRTRIDEIISIISGSWDHQRNEVSKDIIDFLLFLHENNLIIIDYHPLFKLGKVNKNVNPIIDAFYKSNCSKNEHLDLLFIIPNSPNFESTVLKNYYTFSPLGVGYLFSEIEKDSNINIGYLNLWPKIITENWLKDMLNSLRPKMIALSCMTENYLNGIRISKICKDTIDCVVVMGGPHVSIEYEDALKSRYVDVCFIGESEHSFTDYINNYFSNNKLENNSVKGIAYINPEKKVIVTPPVKQIENLDTLRFPIIIEHSIKKKKFAVISTSRGCPFSCKFCAAGRLSGKKYRFRSVKNVIMEIKHYMTHYNIKSFGFVDDTITVNRERVIDFCNLLKEKNIKISWSAESRVDFAAKYPKALKLMKNAGCKTLQFGIESGDDKKLKEINKGISRSQIDRALINARKAGLEITGSMIIGIPGDTKESIQETFDFALLLQKKYNANIVVGWFVPYPGTHYTDCLEDYECKNLFGKNYDLFNTLYPNIIGKKQDLDELQRLYFNNVIKITAKNNLIKKAQNLNIDFLNKKNKIGYPS